MYEFNEYFFLRLFLIFVVQLVESYDVSFPVGIFCAVWCICECYQESAIFYGCFMTTCDFVLTEPTFNHFRLPSIIKILESIRGMVFGHSGIVSLDERRLIRN